MKTKELLQNLEDHLSHEDMLALQHVERQTSDTISEQLAERHARKINDLISKEMPPSTMVNQKKWVVNISKRDLTSVVITALKKRTKFLYQSKENSCSKILSSIQTGIHSLSQSAKDDTCLSR